MNLPIVEKLSEAPEVGDCLCRFHCEILNRMEYAAVRNREFLFIVNSVAGWNTEIRENAPWSDHSELHAESMLSGNNSFDGDIIFAPTAEAAIERYHASEACPWGKIELHVGPDGKMLEFIESDVLLFNFSPTGIYTLRSCYHDNEVAALHALIGEVIAYQTAEKSGSRDSRIHRELGGER